MPVQEGTHCPGCGLSNYAGLCPHCTGDQDAYERELVPPFPASVPRDQLPGVGVSDAQRDAIGRLNATYGEVAEDSLEAAPDDAVAVTVQMIAGWKYVTVAADGTFVPPATEDDDIPF